MSGLYGVELTRATGQRRPRILGSSRNDSGRAAFTNSFHHFPFSTMAAFSPERFRPASGALGHFVLWWRPALADLYLQQWLQLQKCHICRDFLPARGSPCEIHGESDLRRLGREELRMDQLRRSDRLGLQGLRWSVDQQ